MKRRFKRKGRFFVYILECSNGAYYTGSTNNLTNRVKLHNAGRGAKYTRDRRPVRLVWRKRYRYFKLAVSEEKKIKKLRRLQKKNLVYKNSAVRTRQKRTILIPVS